MVPGPTKSAGKKVRPIQHFGKIPLEFLSWQWLLLSPCGEQAALPGATPPARRQGKTLPSPMLGDSRRQGKKVPRQLQGHPER